MNVRVDCADDCNRVVMRKLLGGLSPETTLEILFRCFELEEDQTAMHCGYAAALENLLEKTTFKSLRIYWYCKAPDPCSIAKTLSDLIVNYCCSIKNQVEKLQIRLVGDGEDLGKHIPFLSSWLLKLLSNPQNQVRVLEFLQHEYSVGAVEVLLRAHDSGNCHVSRLKLGGPGINPGKAIGDWGALLAHPKSELSRLHFCIYDEDLLPMVTALRTGGASRLQEIQASIFRRGNLRDHSGSEDFFSQNKNEFCNALHDLAVRDDTQLKRTTCNFWSPFGTLDIISFANALQHPNNKLEILDLTAESFTSDAFGCFAPALGQPNLKLQRLRFSSINRFRSRDVAPGLCDLFERLKVSSGTLQHFSVNGMIHVDDAFIEALACCLESPRNHLRSIWLTNMDTPPTNPRDDRPLRRLARAIRISNLDTECRFAVQNWQMGNNFNSKALRKQILMLHTLTSVRFVPRIGQQSPLRILPVETFLKQMTDILGCDTSRWCW